MRLDVVYTPFATEVDPKRNPVNFVDDSPPRDRLPLALPSLDLASGLTEAKWCNRLIRVEGSRVGSGRSKPRTILH